MSTPVVESISLHPIKSLDPLMVDAARILPSGALEHDREFALFDEHGKVINGKRDARIHRIRAGYNLETLSVSLNSSKTFDLLHDRQEIEDWFELPGLAGFDEEKHRDRFPRRSGIAGAHDRELGNVARGG